MYLVGLSHTANPDVDGGYWTAIYRPESGAVEVSSLDAASVVCQQYINGYDLGSGNWTGGTVSTADGRVVARISYNGRIHGVAA
jgi:hypothetical protein